MSHCNEMICQHVMLSDYAEWPKVADAVIEALIFIAVFTDSNHVQGSLENRAFCETGR
jgi:hypothetical protein